MSPAAAGGKAASKVVTDGSGVASGGNGADGDRGATSGAGPIGVGSAALGVCEYGDGTENSPAWTPVPGCSEEVREGGREMSAIFSD